MDGQGLAYRPGSDKDFPPSCHIPIMNACPLATHTRGDEDFSMTPVQINLLGLLKQYS